MGGSGSGRRPDPGAGQRAGVMAALYRDGRTLQQIGNMYGLTRERVRQIINKHFRMTAKDGGAHKLATERAARRAAKRNHQVLAKYGCDLSALKAIRKAYGRKPTYAFVRQKTHARARGIGWELTFWQWWSIWQESGRWEQRGRGQGYMMCRHGDTGPYAISNVYIAPGFVNSADAQINLGNKDPALPPGVRPTESGRFEAKRMIGGKLLHLGTFDTPDLAYAAYLMAAPTEAREAA